MNGLADRGAAIRCVEGSNPTIRNCVLAFNVATDRGGGVYAFASSPRIVRTRLLSNLAGGGRGGGGLFISGESDLPLQVENCLFAGNTANKGGGIYMFSSTTQVEHCTFNGNSAAGGGVVYETSTSNLTIT
ncbi:MAG: right-handed parallel beta-helix repeat-containing protein, partial [Planctomycetes bacterium]|nr:right-handed parallel beta-helix repeat-containing protein [Planctomycetota bacterium]